MTEQTTSTALTCPKCGGQMRAYERNGISIDQCTECRGIFLDRGELERLIEAEDVHYGSGGAQPNQPAPPPDQRGGYYDDRDPYNRGSGGHGGGSKHGGGYGGQRRRRGGFLGDLLDF